MIWHADADSGEIIKVFVVEIVFFGENDSEFARQKALGDIACGAFKFGVARDMLDIW